MPYFRDNTSNVGSGNDSASGCNVGGYGSGGSIGVSKNQQSQYGAVSETSHTFGASTTITTKTASNERVNFV